MFTYDQNTGDTAFIGDRVKICHIGGDMNKWDIVAYKVLK